MDASVTQTGLKVFFMLRLGIKCQQRSKAATRSVLEKKLFLKKFALVLNKAEDYDPGVFQ